MDDAWNPSSLTARAASLENDEAIRRYEDGIRRAPCLEFYVNLGALWISEGRPEPALAPLQKAVELGPTCVPAHVNLAGANSMLGNDAAALASYRNAIALEPDNPETLKRYAAFLGQIGRTDEAAEFYLKLLAARPSVEQFLKFGNCLMAAGRTPEADSADRVLFLPRQKFADYCRLLQVCDVLVDPLHYGAGSSCYDVFSFNLPLVTLPTDFMPGRVCSAFYKKMQINELVAFSAEDYVRKAVQVATDRDYRSHVTERIFQSSDVLFNDMEAVREHERFFDEALADVR